MRMHYFLVPAAAVAAAAASPAIANITVLGNTLARSCFEAAQSNRDYMDGLRHCDQALQESLFDGDRVATLVNRGILRMRVGNLDGAIGDFDEAIERDPGQAEAYLNKGWALLRRDGWNDAVPLFTTALEKRTIRPAIAHLGRGMAYETGGKLKLAYRDYREASALAPTWSRPKDELSRFQVRGR